MIDDEMKYPYIVQDNPKMIISRRDYFAGLALQALILKGNDTTLEFKVSRSAEYADALIKKLDEVKSGQ